MIQPNDEATAGDDYAARLIEKQEVRWKKLLHVQAPYQWNLRRQKLGRTLDIGCGIGRNLETLGSGSVGVDHNAMSIRVARELGHSAFTVDEFLERAATLGLFDGLLVAHVIEHMDADRGRSLLQDYLPYLVPGGRVFFICPQERGYASDPTHVRFTDGADLVRLARSVGLMP